MEQTAILELKNNKDFYIGKDVLVGGWVKNFRESKATSFLEISDGSTFKPLQIVIQKEGNNKIDATTLGQALQLGVAVLVHGVVVSAYNNVDDAEINATKIEIIGHCAADYPIQKKKTSLDFLRTIPHLRVRTNTFTAMLRVRNALSMAIHDFFQSNNFLYVHTPIITGGDAEGAGEAFQVTAPDFQGDFFGAPASLTVSGQLEAEEAAMALGRVYTFGPTFRAENSNTTRHVAEFWMVEAEAAFMNLDAIMDNATAMIKHIINYVLQHCPTEMAFFDSFYEKGLVAKLQTVAANAFVRVDYAEAIDILQKSGKEFKYPVSWGVDLQTEHERYLTDEYFKKPVFVVNYPSGVKAFYMKQNADGRTVAATDLLVPGIGEIIGCSERETDYDKLVSVMQARGMNLANYEHYLALRKYGSVTHSGYGLGLERMLMYLTGITNIRDVQLHPRAVGELRWWNALTLKTLNRVRLKLRALWKICATRLRCNLLCCVT